MNETMKKLSEDVKEKLGTLFASAEFKSLVEQTKAAADSGSFRVIVSSEHQDRQGEFVLQDGIDTGAYMRNPVVLNSHDYYGIGNIIALTESLTKEVIDGVKCTVATGKFAPTETGQIARQLWEGKFLNAASIGFIALTFDAQNPDIITTSEMLEWSFCAVPANSRATRLSSLGLTVEGLRAKGFEITEKAMGDECQMDDGNMGTMQDDGNGGMVCKPKQVEPEKAQPIAEKKDAQQVGIILAQMGNVILDAIVIASRQILDIIQSEFAQSVAGKAQIAELVKADKTLEAIRLQIGELEKTLQLSAPEEHPDGDAAKERSETVEDVAALMKGLNDYLMFRKLLQSTSTAINETLAAINKKMADERKLRR